MQIDEIYAELAASLPTDGEEQDHAVIMTRESVPRPPDEIEADGIVVLHGRHQYSEAITVDKAVLSAKPIDFRKLGLLCLGVLFHPDIDSVDLQLTSPDSEIRTLRIRYETARADRHSPEFHPYSHAYNVTPHALQYFVKNDLDFRLTYETHLRPRVQLTTASEDWSSFQPEEKTHLVGFGFDQGGYGLATAAELFLDLGAPQNNSQFNLEIDMGPSWEGGVDYGSAELRLEPLVDESGSI